MTVRQLLDNLSGRELTEWMAYEVVEPFEPTRGDLRAGVVASTIANVFRGKGQRPYSPQQFVLEFRAPAPDLSADETATMFGMLMAPLMAERKSNAGGEVAPASDDPDVEHQSGG
jgi:hypothetical protein